MTRYLCWCDGPGADCYGTTDEPFTVCDECKSFGHWPMPVPEGVAPEVIEAEVES